MHTLIGSTICLFGVFGIREGIVGQRILRCRIFSLRRMQLRVVTGAAGVFYGRAWVSSGLCAVMIGAVFIYHSAYFVLGPIAVVAFLHAWGMTGKARQVASE